MNSTELALHNTLVTLGNLEGFAKSELERLGYPDDLNSPQVQEILRPRYGVANHIKDKEKRKKHSRAIELYGVLIDFTAARAGLERQEYYLAMHACLTAIAILFAPSINAGQKQILSGHLTGQRKRETDWPPERLVEMEDDIIRDEPDLPPIRRRERIAKASGKTVGAVERAISRQRKKSGQ